jgi:hypothetical protein
MGAHLGVSSDDEWLWVCGCFREGVCFCLLGVVGRDVIYGGYFRVFIL